jgi:hypothetical protein
MTILTDRGVLLDTVRSWAGSNISHSLWSEIPFDSPIFEHLYAGSACYLKVPAEEKHRAHFIELARSAKPEERLKAALELRKFPGEETERVLYELLKDETENRRYSCADTLARVEYGVRAAAVRSLKALGRPVPELRLEREPTEEEQRSSRETYWRKSFTRALSDGWKVLSVEDGETRPVEGRNTTSVILTCGNGDARCRFLLIPKEWEGSAPSGTECLGINGPDSQGARRFFLEGVLPEPVKGKLVQYFGLQKPRDSR